MLSLKLVLFNIIIFYTKCADILAYSTENIIVPKHYLNYSRSDERISKEGFKKDWLPVGFCNSGRPLLKSKFCNGKQDCLDGSDETTERCRSNSCKSDLFRCNYGGCISKISVCNGIYQCADGSDEDYEICRRSNCIIPYPTTNTVYFVLECEECQSGSQVKEGSILSHQCMNKGFLKTDSHDIICRNGVWTPSVPSCKSAVIKKGNSSNKISTTESNEMSNETPTSTASFSSETTSSLTTKLTPVENLPVNQKTTTTTTVKPKTTTTKSPKTI